MPQRGASNEVPQRGGSVVTGRNASLLSCFSMRLFIIDALERKFCDDI